MTNVVHRILGLLSIVGIVSACDSPTDPVGAHGYDLLVSISPADATAGVDALTSLPVTSPGAMRIHYTVKNAGDSAAPAHKLLLYVGAPPSNAYDAQRFISAWDTVEVGSLAPGQAATGVTTVTSSRLFLIGTNASADSVRAFAQLSLPDSLDMNLSNDTASSTPFYVNVAIVSMTLEQSLPPKVKVNEPFPVTLTLTNYSRRATATGVTARLCFIDFDFGCNLQTGYAFFGRYDFAPLERGTSQRITYTTAVTEAAADYITSEYGLQACIVPATWMDPYRLTYDRNEMQGQACPTGLYSGFVVKPDYAACSPPLLTLNVTATLTAHNCGIHLPSTQPGTPSSLNSAIVGDALYMYQFHGVAGQTYTIPEGYTAIYDTEGASLGTIGTGVAHQFKVTKSGTYFVRASTSATLIQP